MDNNIPVSGENSYPSTFVFGDVQHALDYYSSQMLPLGARHSIDWTVNADNGLQNHIHSHQRSQSFAGADLLPMLAGRHDLRPLSRSDTHNTSMTPPNQVTEQEKLAPPLLRHGDSSSSNSTGELSLLSDDPADQENRERRRVQNRNAQRLYRKRKEQSVHDRQKEIGDLREQLEQERKVNRSLSKVIDCLRMSLVTGVALPPGVADLNATDWSKALSLVAPEEDDGRF